MLSKILAGVLFFALAFTPFEVEASDAKTYTNADLECMAKNIYFEARGEGEDGMLMIAEVTLNRVKNAKFPNTICGVVYARKAFSWTAHKNAIREKKLYDKSIDIAEEVLAGEAELMGTDALFFKSKNSYSKFHNGRKMVGAVGNHIFYK